MPIIDDQCRRSRTEVINVPVQCVELFGNFKAGKLEKATAEPIFCAAQAAGFASNPIDCAIWQFVRISGHRHRGFTSE
ncbi:hypothetical protein EB74_25120 [Mycobacterium sp. SWH-M5]|nr:hypothetical protein EB74_25120 [Mycobacterium sp. SWH-M5]